MKATIKFHHNFEFIMGLLATYNKYKKDEDLDFIECPNTDYVNAFINLVGNKYEIILDYLKCGFTEYCSDISYLSMSLNDDFSINQELVNEFKINEKLLFGNINDLSQKLILLSKKIKYDNFFQINTKFYNNIINTLYKNNNVNYSKIYSFYNSKNMKQFIIILSGFINGGFSCNLNNELYSIIGLKNEDDKYIEDNYCYIRNFHEFSHSEVNHLVDKYFNSFENLEVLKNESINNGLSNCYQEKNSTFLYEYFVRANTYVLAMEYFDDNMKEEELNYYESIGFVHIRNLVDTILLKRKNYNSYEELFIKELIPLLNSYSNKLLLNKNIKKSNF